jgi:hypothetical protein
MRYALLLLALTPLLTGCTTTWTKRGATRADFERDHAACEQAASVVPKLVLQSRYEECMQSRGYRMK